MDMTTDSPSLIQEIDPKDEMFAGNTESYFSVGRSALANVNAALRMVGRDTCSSILDLPCGHGRVMRHFRAAFPNARITACDLNTAGVDYCAATFGATPVHSRKRIHEVTIPGTFDLIWCGSLLTHLEEPLWGQFLSYFTGHLATDGVLLFTTHGRLSVKWIRENIHTYGIEPKRLSRLLSDYNSKGFSYAPYPNSPDYGISLSSMSWVLDQIQQYANVRVIHLNEAGWDNHQDVYACVRIAKPF
jgi:cyclopropane fatty-acyl-phospholipid synthase-like methyltransferase